MSTNKKPTIRVYALGGTGAVILTPMWKQLRTVAADPTAAKIEIAFIDAGRSSYSEVDSNSHYVIKTQDDQGQFIETKGSGQDRSANYEAALNSVEDIFYKFPPGDLNVLVHSAGGGSGSSIAMVLAEHLLKDKQRTLVISPVSTATLRMAKNSRDVLQTYVNLTDACEYPLSITPIFNTEDGFGRNEKKIIDMIYSLSALFAEDLKHLDPADVSSFFGYSKLLKIEPQLTTLIGPVVNGEFDLEGGVVLTALSLFKDQKSWLPECTLRDSGKNVVTPLFHKTGHYDVITNAVDSPNQHFLIVDGMLSSLMGRLKEAIANIERSQQAAMTARVKPSSGGKSPMVFS